jgi:UV DNA damage endonuclease
MSYSLCCISNILKDKGVSFGTTTKKRFMQLDRADAINLVSKKTLQNIKTTFETIKHCVDNGWNYRLSCNMFPLLSLPDANLVYEEYTDYKEIEEVFAQCRDFVKSTKIRLSNHPDQFVVLASEKENVVSNSIRELNINAWVMDKFGAEQNYYNPINIHINKTGDCAELASRFFKNLDKCNENVKKRLVLENEDKGVWSVEKMLTYFGGTIPITYDNLHDACNKSGDEFNNMLKCVETWERFNTKPLFHYSESRQGSNPRAHADLPTKSPNNYNLTIDWEIELKSKDYAIIELQRLTNNL